MIPGRIKRHKKRMLINVCLQLLVPKNTPRGGKILHKIEVHTSIPIKQKAWMTATIPKDTRYNTKFRMVGVSHFLFIKNNPRGGIKQKMRV